MEIGAADIIVFVTFVVCVVGLGILKSRHEKTGEDYFLAGRGLSWWLIGFSLIAANISTEQFVGMSGNAASHIGLAIASYEWMAAITLVVVAFAFLPYFLRAGIYTMPEFLEYRYNAAARTIMAVATIFIYMLLVGAVTYSGALTIRTLAAKMGYNVPLMTGSIVIGVIAMMYVAAGGLKACAWADLIQGSALILGGGVILYFAFDKLGGAAEAAKVVDVSSGAVVIEQLREGTGAVERFWSLNKVRMNMFLPATDQTLPWTALIIGLWIPNFYYWGLNQYITQRTLGSSSLSQGQRGIVFAAFLKLLIPFVIVVPGIIAFNLFAKDMQIEATKDNVAVVARYFKANPDTEYVEVMESPDAGQVEQWQPGQFMLALYEDEDKMEEVLMKNPYVLAMKKSEFEEIALSEFTVFDDSADKAWKSVYPGLAVEVESYNVRVKSEAEAAAAKTRVEKFIAYKYDTAMAQLLGNVLPQKVGLVGFVLAALLGAVVSSLAAMLNAASTIFTMDVYKKYISPEASQKAIVFLGRVCVVVFTFIAVMVAPQLGNPKISNSIFTIIQESQGLISPGVLAVFAFGLIVRRARGVVGVVGLMTNIAAYSLFKLASMNEALMTIPLLKFLLQNFLNRMAVCFILCLVVMSVMTVSRPLAEPVKFEQRGTLDLKPSKGALIAGLIVVVITLALYAVFSPIGISK